MQQGEEASGVSVPNGRTSGGVDAELGNSSLTASPTKSSDSLGAEGFAHRHHHRRRSSPWWNRVKSAVRMSNSVDPDLRKNAPRQDTFLELYNRYRQEEHETSSGEGGDHHGGEKKPWTKEDFVLDPDGDVHMWWIGLVTCGVVYNMWLIIARTAWVELQTEYAAVFYALDYVFDLLLLLDIVVHFRTSYLEQGLLVYSPKKLARNYVFSKKFVLDVLCLLPLDFLYFAVGVHPLLRSTRFLKTHRVFEFYFTVESRTHHPTLWRVFNLVHVLFLLIHWFAGFYFLISKAEGFGSNTWVYPSPTGQYASLSTKYLWSLYWSCLTLTTIGDLPTPVTNYEFLFTLLGYLMGIFVFAIVVGQVGNVIANRNADRLQFERMLDSAKTYMKSNNIPEEMQRRVQRWYGYSWSRGLMRGGGDINSLGLLPDRIKIELALQVNLQTLKKVTIFQQVQPEFLYDLVLKMKAFIFTPGDLICRRGEVAREMFIINHGILDIISETGRVITQLKAGDFFGEIGILNLDGGVNKRTADVRSVGYSELFALYKEDVLAAMEDFPEAKRILTEYGRRRLRVAVADREKREDDELVKKVASRKESLMSSCKAKSSQDLRSEVSGATTDTPRHIPWSRARRPSSAHNHQLQRQPEARTGSPVPLTPPTDYPRKGSTKSQDLGEVVDDRMLKTLRDDMLRNGGLVRSRMGPSRPSDASLQKHRATLQKRPSFSRTTPSLTLREPSEDLMSRKSSIGGGDQWANVMSSVDKYFQQMTEETIADWKQRVSELKDETTDKTRTIEQLKEAKNQQDVEIARLEERIRGLTEQLKEAPKGDKTALRLESASPPPSQPITPTNQNTPIKVNTLVHPNSARTRTPSAKVHTGNMSRNSAKTRASNTSKV
ncbi:PREDICTED: cyclic nucleotide-gated cation channel alpha-3-like [Branchiostoma belcheri]|uniref:Cyclic nucleotide-gated cation channel alpha-3-like n=1 Tax=Branchiostoma belcheri TaxID=7741 RepID=A0A6P4Y8B1_BRABE|nr:PREDICTED: cyclic nucleotide-gated cation channel alpha-3-like [Branchiostoma belcheri]